VRRLVNQRKRFQEAFRGERRDVSPAYCAWAHICVTDLIRDAAGRCLVLEDNLRVPSRVSYEVENREITKRVFPELFRDLNILPVDDYTVHLQSMVASLSPRKRKRPTVVVLTPGIYNSACFEHALPTQGMGTELVEDGALFAEDGCIFMRTGEGPQRVDLVYRRIDDVRTWPWMRAKLPSPRAGDASRRIRETTSFSPRFRSRRRRLSATAR
jgi:uncharacterized circularly permuted ATP-grasp superfamily protein